MGFDLFQSGRGTFHLHWRCIVRYAGANGKANVGISNDKQDEKSCRRKSKVSWAMLVISGLVRS